MALSDIHASLKRHTPHQICACCHILAGMSDEDAAILRDLLADRSVRYKDLAREFEVDPDLPSIDWQVFSRHARGECAAREKLRA